MKLDVPFHRQKTDYTCGPAALQMVFGYFKDFISQEELAQKAKTDKENGTTNQHMIETVRKNGFFCYVNDNSTLNEIKHFIELGLPVIVNYIEPSDNEGHFAVVSGCTRRNLILNDPWNGKGFVLKQSDFMERWRNQSGTHPQWIMVVSGEDFHLGKQYGPVSNSSLNNYK